MALSRRGFLGGIIAASIAPAIIRPGLLMPIKPVLDYGTGEFWLPESSDHPMQPMTGWEIVGLDQFGNRVVETIKTDSRGFFDTRQQLSQIISISARAATAA